MSNTSFQPILVAGAGSALAQTLQTALESKGLPFCGACSSQEGLAACQARGWPAIPLGDIETLPERAEALVGAPIEALVDFLHSPLECLLPQAGPADIDQWAIRDIAQRARLLRACSRAMLARRRGRCLFVSSSAALRPGKGQGFYAAAKLAGESLYRSIGLELASRGVTACSLRLSWIDAGRGATFLAGRRQKAEELMPSGRLVTARQATDALLFLLQEGSAAFNAVALDLDGGFSAVKPVC